LIPTTLTKAQLDYALDQAVRHPHGHVHKGELILHSAVFADPDRETNILISRFALLDCTGSIELGPWCNISARCRIYTHDHIHLGRRPLLAVEEEHGVIWQDKKIGADVWIHDGTIVLYQVTNIPDGVVIGAGSVLTKNPGPYEIWAGNPARKIGTRAEATKQEIEELSASRGFRLFEIFDDTGK
jgi:UDP-3-O-[3-hydroxymyristoyl] glucosamine N-acyltransferase